MDLDLLRTVALVTAGAFVTGHALVRLAARKADGREFVPTLAIGMGAISAGLALRETGTLAAAVAVAALALVAVGCLTLLRRKGRMPS